MLIGLCLVVVLVDCSTDERNEVETVLTDETEITTTRTMTQDDFVDAGNDFAFNLLRTVDSKRMKNTSFVLSPLSVAFAMGLLNEGATGETSQQIIAMLGYDGTGTQAINDYCATMLHQLPLLDDSVDIGIANGVFLNQPIKLRRSYLEAAEHYFAAQVETLDFGSAESLNHINTWCRERTQGMIPQVLNNLEGLCYFINTIYFKANWTNEFNPAETQTTWFLDSNFKQPITEVPFMTSNMTVPYAEMKDYQAIRLPFGNGKFCMYILLPVVGLSPSHLMKQLSAKQMKGLNNKIKEQNVIVKIPRFKTVTHTELNDVLSTLGVKRIFNKSAQLGRIVENYNDGDISVDHVFQDAAIEVEENGAKAAAVTILNMTEDPFDDSSTEMPIVFYANRPFLYIITDNTTGSIYFTGTFSGV